MDPFVITRWWAAGISLAILVIFLRVLHGLVLTAQPRARDSREGSVRFRRRGIKALVIGVDGRASTSKFQVVVWTFAVLYAFLFLLLWGRSIGCDREQQERRICRQAVTNQGVFDRFVEHPLEADYYALLGLPTAAALAAKALTENKVVRGELTKPSVDETDEGGGVAKGVTEIVGGDRGQTDLIDFQYVAFNLVALGYFTLEFVTDPAAGLPEIPPTLLALSGVAVAAYSGKKALEKNVTPAITAVIPSKVILSEGIELTITGAGFGERRGDGGRVLLAGFELDVQRWADRTITALLTDRLVQELRRAAVGGSVEVSVLSRDGARSDSCRVEIVEASEPERARR